MDHFGTEIRTHYPRETAAEVALVAHEAGPWLVMLPTRTPGEVG
jgi:hypothetical protein